MIKFYVNDWQIYDVQAFQFQGDMNQPVSNFSLQTSFRNSLFVGDVVSVSDDAGNIYFFGVVTKEVESSTIDSGHSLNFNGKNVPGLLVRDHAYLKEYANQSFESIVSSILNTANIFGYGVNVNIKSSVKSRIIKKFTPTFGESVLDSLARLSARSGIYVYYTYHDNTLNFNTIKDSGPIIKTYNFDSKNGVNANIIKEINITDAGTDFIFNNSNKKVKTQSLVQSGKIADAESPVTTGVGGTTSLAIDKSKYSDTFDSDIIAENFAKRAYSTLGSYHTAPPDNGVFRQARYSEIVSDSDLSKQEQIDKVVRDNMPSCSITLTFNHIEVGLLNGVYKIVNDKLRINGKFLLTGFSVNMNIGNIGVSTLTFTRLGYLR